MIEGQEKAETKIKTDAQHAAAMADIERLWGAKALADIERLRMLGDAVAAYERVRLGVGLGAT